MKKNKELNHSNNDCGKGTGKNCPPPEKSAIKTLTDGIKRQVPFAIEHSISADQIIMQYLSLKNLLEQMTKSERREVEPLVEGMILAWHERREKEKHYIVEGLQELYKNSVPDIIEAYVDRMNHASRESARPQQEGVGGKNLSDKDIEILKIYFYIVVR